MSDKRVMMWLLGIFLVMIAGAMWLNGQQSSGGVTCGQYYTVGCE